MQHAQIAIPGGMSVTIGMPANSGIPPRTVMSLIETTRQCAAMGIRLEMAMESCGVIEIGRDGVLDQFLKGSTQKLFWIDSDMVWTPREFVRLLALSCHVDLLCATYPAKVDGPPTFYVNYDAGLPAGDFGLLPIKGAGLGFTIVDRAPLERLAASKPQVLDDINGRTMAAVFRVDTFEGKRRTEDMAFFADLADLGYQLWLDPMIALGHIGTRMWRGAIIDTLPAKDTAAA